MLPEGWSNCVERTIWVCTYLCRWHHNHKFTTKTWQDARFVGIIASLSLLNRAVGLILLSLSGSISLVIVECNFWVSQLCLCGLAPRNLKSPSKQNPETRTRLKPSSIVSPWTKHKTVAITWTQVATSTGDCCGVYYLITLMRGPSAPIKNMWKAFKTNLRDKNFGTGKATYTSVSKMQVV